MRDIIVSTSDRRIFFFLSLSLSVFVFDSDSMKRAALTSRSLFYSNALITGGCLDGHLVFFRGERFSSTAIGFVQRIHSTHDAGNRGRDVYF